MDQLHTFFIISPLGLEDIILSELENNIRELPAEIQIKTHLESGGITLSAPLDFGLKLNHILKTPTRILMRIDHFKCKDAPKLYNKISKIPWAKYILGDQIEVEATSSESRLFDSRKIEKATINGIIHYIHSNPLKKKYLTLGTESKFIAKIYIRLAHDECTVSIDTSGELLHKRGEKELTGHAPIRENLAAALLIKTFENLKVNEFNLIDPMCGSGTFLIEAKRRNTMASQRIFSYQYMPIHIEDKNKFELQIPKDTFKIQNVLGFDIDDKIIEQAKANLTDYQISLFTHDLFSKQKIKEDFTCPNIVIINPPYGIRVKSDQTIDSNYYKNIIEQIELKFNPIRIGIIVPAEYTFNFSKNYSLISKTKLKNGGIPIIFYVLASK